MLHKKIVLAFLSVSVLCADLSANEKRAEYFMALESALKNNKEIISAQKNLLAIHENHVISSAALKPRATANAEVAGSNSDQWISDDKSDTFQNGTNTTKSYGISFSQNIFNGFADLAALKETDLNIRAQWSEYEAIKQKVLREVSELYFNLIAKKQEVAHLEALLKSRQSVVELATQMYSTGSVKYLDVAQAQADSATTEGRLATAEAEYETLKAQFEEKTGIPLPANLSVPEKLFDTNLTASKAKDIALKYNPEIIASTDRLAASKEAIKKPNPGFRPSLDLQAGFNQSLDKNKTNNRGESVRLTLTIPVFDGGTGRAQKRQAIETTNRYAVEKDKLIKETQSNIISTFAAMEAAKENLACSKKAVEASELALHDTEEEFKAGLKITKDVLDAQQKLFEAKFVETQAERQYFVSQCTANALLGRMSAKYLKIKDSDFDYKKHFEETKLKF